MTQSPYPQVDFKITEVNRFRGKEKGIASITRKKLVLHELVLNTKEVHWRERSVLGNGGGGVNIG